MTFDEFRREMWAYREDAQTRARQMKDSVFLERRLQQLYRSFDTVERAMADKVLCEWVLSPSESVRFDALGIILDFKILAAITALRQLAMRLRNSDDVGAPYELRKVERIIATLEDRNPDIPAE